MWFQDGARLGQKNGPCPDLGADRHAPPRPPADQRYGNVYLFGAICPLRHAVALMDRGGRHKTDTLKVTKTPTIILLPSRSPELNPVENIWRYLRQNWLSNRVFEDATTVLDAGCNAWNSLLAQPQTTLSIGMRDWAYGSPS